MLADIGFAGSKKLNHLRLRKPYRFILKLNINFSLPVFSLINKDLIVNHFCHNFLILGGKFRSVYNSKSAQFLNSPFSNSLPLSVK